MTSTAAIADRIEQAITELQPLLVQAERDEDAAYSRRQLRIALVQLAAAKRLVSGLVQGAAFADRRHACEDLQPVTGLTFACAVDVKRAAPIARVERRA